MAMAINPRFGSAGEPTREFFVDELIMQNLPPGIPRDKLSDACSYVRKAKFSAGIADSPRIELRSARRRAR